MPTPDVTVDPARQSFVEVAADSHFPIQNLPYGVFQRRGHSEPHCGVAIGDRILDLTVLENRGSFMSSRADGKLFDQGSFNSFAATGPACWRETRFEISRLLHDQTPDLRDDSELLEQVMVAQSDVEMRVPMEIGDYTDFYSSREHATNVGTMFRGADNALNPNWLHLPVAYHGRSSSIVASGTPIRRPCGQTMPPDAESPKFGPCKALDFELEMGFFVGPGTPLGEAIRCDQAEEHIFGMVLVNDWSARDIQRWEYVPLGPFLAKNFATSISPWIVPLDAFEPFRCQGPRQDPEPLPYLRSAGDATFDLELEVHLRTGGDATDHVICRSNFRYLYWSMRQQLAHHSVTGCNMSPGDLLASGTISGPTEDSYGSMLELAWKGEKPIALPNGESRSMLQDGDTVLMTGWAQGDGYRVGFGSVEGLIQPARDCG